MADAILLSQDTYDRIMKAVEAFENGNWKVIPGTGLKYEETGGGPEDGGGPVKIGVDGVECP